MTGRARRLALAALAAALAASEAPAADVSGLVAMPDVCSPAVSPAVVRLEPVDAPAKSAAAVVHEVGQRGLRFEPRVVAVRAGEVVRFGNSDPELHDVHVQGPGVDFNRGVAPAGAADFVPERAGVLRVLCDVHSHMRAFVVVGTSPWVAACDRAGAFRFRGVPEGRYRLHVWHEMGAPLDRDVEVRGAIMDLGTVAVTEGPNPVTADDREQVCEKGCEPWPLVIDRIAVTLAAGLDAAQRPASSGRAVPLVQDAFYRDFGASGMDAAVRVHLGLDRAARIEEAFRDVTRATATVVSGEGRTSDVAGPTRQAILSLVKASEELNRKGVTERSKTFAGTSPAFWVAEAATGPARATEPVGWTAVRWAVRGGGLAAFLGAALVTTLAMTLVRSEAGRPFARKAGAGVAVGVLAAVLMWLVRPPDAEPAGPPPAPSTPPPTVPDVAPIRENPIGLDVTRNHLNVAAVWHRAVRPASSPAPGPGEVHLAARIHATGGNPNGFAKGEWVPYLSVRYTVTPADGGPPLTGTLRPLITPSGPRYGANLRLPGPGDYRLTLRIEPPSADALDRLTDPAAGVAPWWEPFTVGFDWSHRP